MYSKLIFAALSCLLIVQSSHAMRKRPKATDDSQEITIPMHKPVLPSQELIDCKTEMKKIDKEWFKHMTNIGCLDCCCSTLFGTLIYFSNIDGVPQ